MALRVRISHPALQVAIIKLTDPPLLGAGHLVPTFRLNRVLWSTTFVVLLAFSSDLPLESSNMQFLDLLHFSISRRSMQLLAKAKPSVFNSS